MFRIGKSIRTEGRLFVAMAGGREKWEGTANGYRISLEIDETILQLNISDQFTTLSIY